MRKFNIGDKVASKTEVRRWVAGETIDPKIGEIYQITEKAEGVLYWAVGIAGGVYEKELLFVSEIKEYAIKFLAERMALVAGVNFVEVANANPNK